MTGVLALLVTVGNALATNPIKKDVPVKDATVTWVGKKVTGSHTGTINLKEGNLVMEGDALVGGTFVIDMTTIQVTDLQAGRGKEKLEGHLNSGDFFGVEEFPTATFEITKATKSDNGYAIVGNMTIKGVTESMEVNLTMDGNTMTTQLLVDRTKFGIRYGSASFVDNLKNKAINDDFELNISFSI